MKKKIADSSLQMSQMIYNKALAKLCTIWVLYADIDSEMPFIHYILFKATVKRQRMAIYSLQYFK